MKTYDLKFNHESDNSWYIDLPHWPFSHANLQMVAGADTLCEIMSEDDQTANVNVIASSTEQDLPDYVCLERTDYTITGGAHYNVHNCEEYNGNIWLCPVTLFVMQKYPKYIYVKRNNAVA